MELFNLTRTYYTTLGSTPLMKDSSTFLEYDWKRELLFLSAICAYQVSSCHSILFREHM